MITIKHSVIPRYDTEILDLYSYLEYLHGQEYEVKNHMNDPIAYISREEEPKDTFYYHESMKEDNNDRFVEAIIK